MKSILLSFCFLMFAALVGQTQTTLSLSDTNGVAIENGSTIVMNGVPEDAELVTHLWVKNNSAHSLSVKAKKVEISLLPNTNVTFCWAGNCFPPTVYESPNGAPIAAGAIDKEFSGHYAPSLQKGQTKVQWVFWDEADVANSVSVFVDYNTFPAGSEELAESRLNGAYPNPASSLVNIKYNLLPGNDGYIILRNILGAEVAKAPISSGSGKVTFSVDNLSEGVYFYTLLLNGKATSTGKVVVRH